MPVQVGVNDRGSHGAEDTRVILHAQVPLLAVACERKRQLSRGY